MAQVTLSNGETAEVTADNWYEQAQRQLAAFKAKFGQITSSDSVGIMSAFRQIGEGDTAARPPTAIPSVPFWATLRDAFTPGKSVTGNYVAEQTGKAADTIGEWWNRRKKEIGDVGGNLKWPIIAVAAAGVAIAGAVVVVKLKGH